MNKKLKKIIRYRNDTSSFYKVDRYLKITKVNIKNIIKQERIDGGIKCLVDYEYGINLINPFSWIFIILGFLGGVIEVGKEIVEGFKMTRYRDDFKIKD